MATGGSTPQFGERAEYGADDVCYRHPDAHSFTLCQRCGRTICPKCQTSSAVGVLCPDCVRDMQPGTAQRVGRSVKAAGRRAGTAGTPIVTYGIIVVSLLVFAAQLLTHYFGSDGATLALWYAPLYSYPEVFEPWRLVTVMFTHSVGFLPHILFNMFALWVFGRNLEQMIGRGRFLLLYLFSGIGGGLGVMFWAYADPSSVQTPTVGASGAIFGIMAATLIAFKAARVNITSLAVLIVINFGIGLMPGANISWQAHLGGLVVGAITMALIVSTQSRRRRGLQILGLVALGLALAALSMAYMISPPLPVTFV